MPSDPAKATCLCELPGVTQGMQQSYTLTVLGWDLGDSGQPVAALTPL